MNELEETLRVVQTQITYLKMQMKQEDNPKRLSKLNDEIHDLKKEEQDILRRLGL